MNSINIISKHILKNNKELILIKPDPEYAEAVVEFIKTVDEESPFLGRESRDARLSVTEMGESLKAKSSSENEAYFIGIIDGAIVVECSVSSISSRVRFAHRSRFGIVVLKKYWGIGIGRIAVNECINLSKYYGYEQLELGVSVENEAAINLYKSLGFEIYGTIKHAMKYADGNYADEHSMVLYFK